MISNLGPSTPVNRASAPSPLGGIPMAPNAVPANPQEQVTLGQTPAAVPSPWVTTRHNNGVSYSVLKDQGSQVTQAVVATLAPGPLVPAGITLQWSADSPKTVQASLTDKPDVKIGQPVIADDGQIYVQIEPAGGGSNPNAPFLVFNPQTMAHGLSDGLRPDGQGGFVRGTQEYQNADGSFTLIADERRQQTPDGVARSYTRIEASPTGMKAADVEETPVSKSSQAMKDYGMMYLTGGLSLLMPKAENTGIKAKETPVEVRPGANGLEVTHPQAKGLPSLQEIKEKAGQYADSASTSASNFNQSVSGKLGGSLKKLWDFGMSGGMLGQKGYNVGQGFFNKGAEQAPPTAPPAAEPPRISVVHPFSAVAPTALFPGLSAALHA